MRIATLLVLAALASGCLTTAVDPAAPPLPSVAELSQPVFDVLDGESIFYEASSDGASLHLRLWRPADAPEEWKAPAILVMSPYFGPDSREGYDENDPTTWDPAARPAYWRYQWLIDHFVPRGYAVALADVRGTGESGGCLEQTAALQSQDGYDTVEWLAAQPWSNGKVGMYGKSYDAETQQSTATLAPPHLTTIVPVSSVSGQYEYSYYDAVPYTLQTFWSNFYYMQDDGLQLGSTVESHRALPTRVGCNADHMRQGFDDSGTWNAYWEAREIRRGAEDVKASVLYVHGLQDWNVKPIAIRDWFDRLQSPKLGMLGQWAHDYPEENRYEESWSRQDWQELVWRWYDHWLLGRDTGIEALLGTVQVQDNAGRWRVQDAYPLAGTPVTFEWKEAQSYQEALDARLGAESPLQLAQPTARYETEPLATELRWSGWPTLEIDAALDKDDAHFAVALYAIDASGKETWLNNAYLSAQHRDGRDRPAPVPIGQTLTYTLRFFPSDTVVPAGSKLALVVAPRDAWTSGAGNGHTATITRLALTIPHIEVAPQSFLDVKMGDPIREPVT